MSDAVYNKRPCDSVRFLFVNRMLWDCCVVSFMLSFVLTARSRAADCQILSKPVHHRGSTHQMVSEIIHKSNIWGVDLLPVPQTLIRNVTS